MTALRKYARLEASGLWRSGADAQRRDVIVSIGDASTARFVKSTQEAGEG